MLFELHLVIFSYTSCRILTPGKLLIYNQAFKHNIPFRMPMMESFDRHKLLPLYQQGHSQRAMSKLDNKDVKLKLLKRYLKHLKRSRANESLNTYSKNHLGFTPEMCSCGDFIA